MPDYTAWKGRLTVRDHANIDHTGIPGVGGGAGGAGSVGPQGPPGADSTVAGPAGPAGQSVTVFKQLTTPTANRVGDIWIKA